MKRQKNFNLFTKFYIIEFCFILPILLFSIIFLFSFFSTEIISTEEEGICFKIEKGVSTKDLYIPSKNKYLTMETNRSFFNISSHNNKTNINEISQDCLGKITSNDTVIFFNSKTLLFDIIPKTFFLENVTLKYNETDSSFYADKLFLDMHNNYDIKAKKIHFNTL